MPGTLAYQCKATGVSRTQGHYDRYDHSCSRCIEAQKSARCSSSQDYITVQVILHRWHNAMACALYSSVAINYTDDATLTEEVLLEPSSLALHIEQASASSKTDTAASPDAAKRLCASVLPLRQSDEHMSLPRPKPDQLGLTVQIRYYTQPLVHCASSADFAPAGG